MPNIQGLLNNLMGPQGAGGANSSASINIQMPPGGQMPPFVQNMMRDLGQAGASG